MFRVVERIAEGPSAACIRKKREQVGERILEKDR